MSDETTQKLRSFDLVSDAINAKPIEDRYLNEFKAMLDNDFEKGLCKDVAGVNHAETMKEMVRILREMQIIVQCPELHSKSVGAIGGGFSSGKSSFINSFLDSGGKGIKLAEGINPVTVIPSYVICDKTSKIKGISFQRGSFDISADTYNSLSHDFIKKTFTFDLNRIVFYTTVLTPMKNEYFQNLCLIDTPGYNPPSAGNTKHDFENAKRYIKDAEFLVWIISVDSGTIPKSDIAFLQELGLFGIEPEYPLYIVANKAQLKSADTIEDILDTFEKVLDDNDISYVGISAYDSKTKKQYAHRKKDLFEFLSEHNKPSERHAELQDILHDVFKLYVGEIHRKHEEEEANRKKVKDIMLDALQGGNISIDDRSSGRMEEGLNDLLHYFKPEEAFDKSLKRVTAIREKFMTCLVKFCEAHGLVVRKPRYCVKCRGIVEGRGSVCDNCKDKTCTKCGKVFPATSQFCTSCGGTLR